MQGTLPAGDICLAGNPDVVVERKTIADLVACIGAERDRFERVLHRATHLASFAVVVSGSFADLLRERRGLHQNAVVGSLAAWQRRYRLPFFFAGADSLAANFTLRFLCNPLLEAQRLMKAYENIKDS